MSTPPFIPSGPLPSFLQFVRDEDEVTEGRTPARPLPRSGNPEKPPAPGALESGAPETPPTAD